MTLNTKLLIAGLAVGITAYILYRKSKQHEKNKITAGQQYQWKPSSQAQLLGAGPGTAGAGIAAATTLRPGSGQDVEWAALKDPNHISDILSACVTDQHLYAFYDFNRIHHLASQLAYSGALYDCCEAWQLPPALGQDLVKLALFDISFLLDDSLSMQSEGHLRRDSLKAILMRAADAGARFDPDGMEVQWMNGQRHEPHRIRSASEASDMISKCKWDGRATPMGASLEKMLNANVLSRAEKGALYKPALVVIITDGRPTGQHEHDNKLLRVIRHAKDRLARTQYGADAISFSICAVGNDREAQDFLDLVDSDSQVGGIVDVTSDRRIEAAQIKKKSGIELTEELHCLKVMLGGIDSSYDASDESNTTASRHRHATREKAHHHHREKREAFQTQQWHHNQQEAYRLGLAAPQRPSHMKEDHIHNQQYLYDPAPALAPTAWPQSQQNYGQQQAMVPPSQSYGYPQGGQPYGQGMMPYSQNYNHQAPNASSLNYNSPYPSSQSSAMSQPDAYPSAQAPSFPAIPSSSNNDPPPYPGSMDSSVGGFMMPSANPYQDQHHTHQHKHDFPSAYPSF